MCSYRSLTTLPQDAERSSERRDISSGLRIGYRRHSAGSAIRTRLSVSYDVLVIAAGLTAILPICYERLRQTRDKTEPDHDVSITFCEDDKGYRCVSSERAARKSTPQPIARLGHAWMHALGEGASSRPSRGAVNASARYWVRILNEQSAADGPY